MANNAAEYDEPISITCNETPGLSYTYDYEEVVDAQQIKKGTININNSNTDNKTIICLLSNEELETNSIVNKVKKVFFASDGYENETPYKLITDSTYGELPNLELPAKDFEGWYNQEDELIIQTTDVSNPKDEVLYAQSSQYKAKYVSFDNSKFPTTCTDLQCALEELNEMIGS